MNIIQQVCSNPTGWAAITGWGLYGVSEAVGANKRLRDNTAIGFALHALQAVLPVDVEVRPKAAKRRKSRTRRAANGRFTSQDVEP